MPGTSSENFRSDWILLQKDAYYPIESWHSHDGSTEGHFSVALEYEQKDSRNHQHTLREIQVLAIHPENIKEKFTI